MDRKAVELTWDDILSQIAKIRLIQKQKFMVYQRME